MVLREPLPGNPGELENESEEGGTHQSDGPDQIQIHPRFPEESQSQLLIDDPGHQAGHGQVADGVIRTAPTVVQASLAGLMAAWSCKPVAWFVRLKRTGSTMKPAP